MRQSMVGSLFALSLMSAVSFAQAGPPPGGPSGPGGGIGGAGAVNGSELLVTRMLKFDKNDDGQLSLDEITDGRLHRLFRRADADMDGTVTKVELTAVAAAITAEFPNVGRRGGPGGRHSETPP